jgi:hypothetical protein
VIEYQRLANIDGPRHVAHIGRVFAIGRNRLDALVKLMGRIV